MDWLKKTISSHNEKKLLKVFSVCPKPSINEDLSKIIKLYRAQFKQQKTAVRLRNTATENLFKEKKLAD